MRPPRLLAYYLKVIQDNPNMISITIKNTKILFPLKNIESNITISYNICSGNIDCLSGTSTFFTLFKK